LFHLDSPPYVRFADRHLNTHHIHPTQSLITSTRDIQKTLKYVFRLFPPFCLGDVMVGLATRNLSPFLLGTAGVPGPWDMLISGWDLVFMAVESVVYFAATLVLEKLVNMPEMQACVPPPTVTDPYDTHSPLRACSALLCHLPCLAPLIGLL
jgi:hypothetical protein